MLDRRTAFLRHIICCALLLACALVPAACWAASIDGKHCSVEYSGVLVDYAKAFAAIYDCAWDGYKEELGIELPRKVTINVNTGAGQTRLWTDGESNIYLELATDRDLLPDSGYLNIYGMCHEPGHISMYSQLSTLNGLPDGVGEGWAHYCGSVVLDYVWGKLGESVYPVPHDYSRQGTARLRQQYGEAAADSAMSAATTFYTLGTEFSHKKVGRAMRAALKGGPAGYELIGSFAKQIDKLTGGKGSAMIPDSMRKSKIEPTSEMTVIEDFGDRASAVKLDEGWLYYDDDSEDGRRSIAGSGHAVRFDAPGGGTLKAIQLKGSRYGLPDSISKFKIYILDGSFEVIDEINFPYMEFEQRGEQLYWREFPVASIKVPEKFTVLFSFDPTATDGIYVGFDADSSGHSYIALPDGDVEPFYDGDWMIRVKVE